MSAATLRTSLFPLRLGAVVGRRAFSSTGMVKATWGFVGLGRMGYPMAANLRAKIHKDDVLLVNDTNAAATAKFVEEYGRTGTAVEAVGSVREVAERASTVITVLPEPTHVKSVFSSILASPLPTSTPSRLFIDCSTIDPTTSRNIASSIPADAGTFVDAPMSGGVVGARAATLTFMLGGPAPLVPVVTSTLLHMGARVWHLGPQGSGLAAKLANNYLLAISNIATAEAMNLGLKLGLDGVALGSLINSSSGRCWASEINNPVLGVSKGAPVERDYEGGFGAALMNKDLRLAREAAAQAGAKLLLGEEAGKVYESVVKEVGGTKDFGVVYQWLGTTEWKTNS